MNYSQIIQVLAYNILTDFDEVFFDAEIITTNKSKFPAIAFGEEWITLEPSDQKEIVYIRRNGDDEVIEELKLGGCVKSYRMRSNLRIVYFKDHAKNHSEILARMMQSVLVSGTKLKSIIKDKWKLLKDESSGDYNFGATTAYFAIDVYAFWDLIPNTCDEDFCIDIQNPLKKESCPVAV